MLENLFTISPAIVLGITSLLCLTSGVIRMLLYIKAKNVQYSLISIHSLLAIGCLGLVGDCIILAAFSASYKTLFLVLIGMGCLLSVLGEIFLYKNILDSKKYLFVVWVIVTGNLLVILPLPVFLHLREPFILLYVLLTFITIALERLLLRYWTNMRKNDS